MKKWTHADGRFSTEETNGPIATPMELPDGNLRSRRRTVKEVVQDFDAFVKVVDDVKEEKKASNGILSIVCFSLITWLVLGQLYDFFTRKEFDYKFSVDTEYDERPTLDIDMIVATPCNNLAIMPMAQDNGNPFSEPMIKKHPTRFEMSEKEAALWKKLQDAHQEQFRPGSQLKGLEDMTFVSKNVEKGLQEANDIKQQQEIEQIKMQRKMKGLKPELEDDRGGFVMVGGGFGFFQIISHDSIGGNQGTACRVHGKLPVIKGRGDRLSISIGKSFGIGGLVAHFDGPGQSSNTSHRIERFHFGQHVWGLVTPLAGSEQMSKDGSTMYRYYVKVVPTRIYHSGIFGSSTLTYQYSVNLLKKDATPGEHSHGGIMFDYEFAATLIEVREIKTSIIQLLLRLCAVIGGIFATSSFLNAIFSRLFVFSKS